MRNILAIFEGICVEQNSYYSFFFNLKRVNSRPTFKKNATKENYFLKMYNLQEFELIQNINYYISILNNAVNYIFTRVCSTC